MKRRFSGLLILLLLLTACGAQTQPESPPPPDPNTIEHIVPDITNTPAPELPEMSPPEPANPELEIPPPEPTEPEPEIPVLEPEPEIPVLEPEPLPASTAFPVLMYHHVVPDGTACNDMTVTAGKLEQDLLWLREHGYESVLPRQLAAGEPLPEKPVMITFDDGYTSNYELLFPLLQKHKASAVISAIVWMPDIPTTNFCTWDMYREMSDSGLVEIGSHTYRLHNLDGRNGNFTPGGINGIQRQADETDESFHRRVLDDLQKSHDRLEEELGVPVTCFAYPFGMEEPDAEELIEQLFPVTLLTKSATADLSGGFRKLPRWTVTMNTSLSSVLAP